ncbi:cellulose binding domain-containing protein [Sphaerisporangium rufum]|uniref:cellulose binding domain-containing protein n=1 Tax=Sphaerisporangium rufum TaxID=1381558 RepID=UPI0019519098|nr:cellulose binding domain-containing protein [Sphaerisporangium rufum]
MRGLLIGSVVAAATAAVLGAGPAAAGSTPAAVPAAARHAGAPAAEPAALVRARAGMADADTTPPSTPGDFAPFTVYSNGAVGLRWKPSTDDVGVTGYEVYAWSFSGSGDVPFSRVQTFPVTPSPENEVQVYATGLTPYQDYLFYVVAVDAAGNRSVPTLLAQAEAMSEPPTPRPSPVPATPVAPSNLAISYGPTPDPVWLSWSGNNAGPAITYSAFRRSATEWRHEVESTLPRTQARTEGGYAYTFQVVAHDATGTLSGPSNAATYQYAYPTKPPGSPTPTPTPTVTPACDVAYRATGWDPGFTVWITIRNTGSTPIIGWRLGFAFPLTTQRLVSGWSATWAQSGTAVSATGLGWNARIDPGQSLLIGFNGTSAGSNPQPTAFTLNGGPCTAS